MIFALAAVTISRAMGRLERVNNNPRVITAMAAFVMILRWSDRINNAKRPFLILLAVVAKLSAHYPVARSTINAILDVSDKATQILTRRFYAARAGLNFT